MARLTQHNQCDIFCSRYSIALRAFYLALIRSTGHCFLLYRSVWLLNLKLGVIAMYHLIASEIECLVFEYLSQIKHKRIAEFLEKWPIKPLQLRAVSTNELPVLRHLSQVRVHANSKSLDLLYKIQECSSRIFWGQTYAESDFGQEFLNNYCWTELIGTRGPIVSDEIACGFLLLGPNTHYPGHSHEAEEFYVPLTEALWKKGSEDWQLIKSEVPIYHKSWISHSMKTQLEPLLALYIWKNGNLAQKSKID